MFSQLTNYLFGAENNVQPQETADGSGMLKEPEHSVEEDWVLVNSNDDGASTSTGNRSNSVDLGDWQVTSDLPVVMWQHNQRRKPDGRQPKGTKPRKGRGRNRRNPPNNGDIDIDVDVMDIASLDSSIAVVPGPESRAAAEALLRAAALADAKQMSAIAAARTAQGIEMKMITRSFLERANKIVDVNGGKGRRRHMIATRLCGSNNNRKC